MKTVSRSQKKKNWAIINKTQWKKAGLLLQIAPDQYLLGAGPFSSSTEPALDKWSLFHPPFFSSESSNTGKGFWYIPSATVLFSKEELLILLEDQRTKTNIADWQWQEPSFPRFQEFFFKVHKQIKLNKIQKVVPAFFETADYSIKKQDILILIHRLISQSDSGTAYAWWSGQKAIIGSTPEYLFRKEKLYVQTMALAGTARDSWHDLLKDSKEKWEHQLVVEEIKNLLFPLGEYRFSDTYIHSVGDIQHLRTDFKLQLKRDISFKKLCYLLHPTPALGGFPRKEALSLLAELHEQCSLRYSFGAPFGILKGDKAFCLVAIRNIQFIEGKAYLGSGCGLVKGSQMEKEWEELKKKRQIIKDILF